MGWCDLCVCVYLCGNTSSNSEALMLWNCSKSNKVIWWAIIWRKGKEEKSLNDKNILSYNYQYLQLEIEANNQG